MKLGFLGLGKMGSRMAGKLVKENHTVVAWNRSPLPVEEFIRQNPLAKTAQTIQEVVKSLEIPRIIWIMVPAGEATESLLKEASYYMESGDILIDGGNSYFEDTQRHFEQTKSKKIKFLGIGVSGGIIAAAQGYPLMAGGDKSAYEYIMPILDSLAKPDGGHEYFGEGGAGHFVKMVHNAIEYSYMQGIGEGFGVLENSSFHFDLAKVAKLYTKNTLVSGFMMDRAVEVLTQDPSLESLNGVIGKASGETIWTIDEAKKQNLPIENIEQALQFRKKSETDVKIQESFAARMVSALRNAFGGHTVDKKK